MSGFSIKQYLPRTLLGRSLLILITPVLLIQVITSFMFFDRHWTKVTTHLAFAVAGEVAVITSSLKDGSDPDKVERIIGYAAQFLDLNVAFQEGEALPADQHSSLVQVWESVVARKLHKELDAMIAENFVVHTNFAEKHVGVFVQLSDGVLSVELPQRRLFSSSAYVFLLWMIGTSLLLLFVAILFMRNQIRPIRKLAVATDRFGKGRDTPFFKPEGASEVRQAGAAFLDMRRRIERQISQRTEMLAGVSHDLRTPLTRMRLQTEMLPEGADKDGVRQDIQDMEKMIEGYLDFVRGDGDEDIENTSLHSLMNKLAANAEKLGDVNCALDIPVGLSLPVRPLSFERALANVVNNAARYAGKVSVFAFDDGEKIQIEIEDDGPGVPEELYEEVFKPFTRVDTSRNSETGGVGLGLPIAMDIVHGHGGKIWLEKSETLGGLKVVLRMPAS